MCGLVCDPRNWAAARRAGVRVRTVVNVRAALFDEAMMKGGDVSGFDAEGWAAMLGLKQDKVAAVVAALADKGVIVDGRLAEFGDDPGDAERHGDASPASPRHGDARVTRRRALGRARSKRWRANKAAETATIAGGAARSEVTAGAASPASPPDSSLSLFPDHQGDEEQKQTRVPDQIVTDDGFAALRAIWPLSNRMVEAEREYRRALRHVTGAAVLDLARHYLDTKEPWRSCMFLVNWLRTEPWRDPILPLRAPLRPVEGPGEAPRREIEPWLDRLRDLKATGIWSPEWGPRWGEPGCRAPPLETGVGQGFHRYFTNLPMQRTG